MRVYLPATWADLAELAATGVLPAGTRPAHAVTAGVRAALADCDEEEKEYAVAEVAAAGSAASRRVVLVAEVEDTAVDTVDANAADDPSVVQVTVQIRRRDLAALLVDAEGASPEDDLLWFGVQELADLLADGDA